MRYVDHHLMHLPSILNKSLSLKQHNCPVQCIFAHCIQSWCQMKFRKLWSGAKRKDHGLDKDYVDQREEGQVAVLGGRDRGRSIEPGLASGFLKEAAPSFFQGCLLE